MSRYIDADLLYKETKKKIKANNEYRMAVVDDEFLDLINDAPTEDVVEVRHGEWYRYGQDYSQCSLCGKVNTNFNNNNYCPNCGAKMDGERREK